MKLLAVSLFMLPLVLTAQNVGIHTTDPQHPFQVNVDSIWTNTIEDQVLGPHGSFLGGLAIIPGVEKGAQRFTVGTAGYFSQMKIYFGFPTDADEVLVEVFRGSEPEEEFMTSGNLLDVTLGARTIIFPQPWAYVSEGEVLNVVITPIAGTSCKWKQGSFDAPEFTAFHYTGTWDTILIDLAMTSYITYTDTVIHDVLKVKEDKRVMFNDYSFPRNDGNAGEVMRTNGAGSLSWSSPEELNVSALQDTDQDTKVEVESTPDDDIIRFTTDSMERMTILQNGKVGIGTDLPASLLHVNNGAVLFNGPEGDLPPVPDEPPASGPGTRMMWYPDKAAFRFGRVVSTEWNRDSIGSYSFAGGVGNKAKGIFSFVGSGEGGNYAIGSHSLIGNGRDNIASGDYAFIGSGNDHNATGNRSYIGGGAGNSASGEYAVITGGSANTASGDYSFIGSGPALFARSYGESAFGTYATDYVPISSISFHETDRLFVVGNGNSNSNRKDALTILKNGSIGVGTSSPEYRVHIEGSGTSSQHILSVQNNYSGTTNVRAIEAIANPANGYGVGGHFTGGSKGIEAYAIGGSSFDTITAVEATATGTAGIRIGISGKATGGNTNWAGYFGNGNVYVTNQLRIGQDAEYGTTGYKLLVDGKIIAEEVRVQLSGDWPDYVFDANYPLPTLEEVESFIRVKKHLQGIPSAAEVQQNGLHLGEMQQSMMQKMEELTLYILQQNNRIKHLEQKLQALEELVKADH